MKYYLDGDVIVISEHDGFDVSATLECGQCFRHARLGEGSYRIIAHGKVLYVKESARGVELWPATNEEFEGLWLDYFSLDADYNEIRARLSSDGEVMKKAVEFSPGLRRLRQESFECLISFIISQNNRIPMIMKCVDNVSRKYGSEIGEGLYAFPTPEQLSKADLEGLADCRVGFRARYIMDAVAKSLSGEIPLDRKGAPATGDLRESLKKIVGVGDKVADCVMLFAYGREELFPADTWIIRAMSRYFFDGRKICKKEIRELAYARFGQYAGMANQYIFHYIRTLDAGN